DLERQRLRATLDLDRQLVARLLLFEVVDHRGGGGRLFAVVLLDHVADLQARLLGLRTRNDFRDLADRIAPIERHAVLRLVGVRGRRRPPSTTAAAATAPAAVADAAAPALGLDEPFPRVAVRIDGHVQVLR